MERSNKYRNRSRKGNKKAKKAPKVPIKTYRWEDIRRARRRGGYPWTHLYKGPFTEKIDPEQFTMDAFRRAKSSSPLGRSERADISEVSSWADYSGKTTPTLLQELISEPQEDDFKRKKDKRPGSVVIEEYFEDNEKGSDDDDVQIAEFQIESGESSDNISQYLEKEERSPATSKFDKEAKKLFKSSKENIDSRGKRAKSEETGTRKRKLSGASNYSKYSLSKLKVLQKLEDAKKKIKVPKISLPTKKIIKRKSKRDKEHELSAENKKNSKKSIESAHLRKTDAPVYIHIPLKPPPGETDEFSHLEFECKQANKEVAESSENKETSSENKETSSESKETSSENKETNSENKEISDEKENIGESEHDKEITNDGMNNKGEKELEKENTKSPFSSLERGPKVTKKPPLKINPAFKQLLKDVRQLKEKELKEETDKTDKIKKESNVNEETLETKTKSVNSEMDTKEVDKETPMDLEEQEQTSESESSPKEDIFDKLFQTSFSKNLEEPVNKTDAKSSKTGDDTARRNVRSKSAEPQNKRRSSMDSSYSRKSLSKLAIMKKLKDASEKIKSTLSMENLRKKFSHKDDQKSSNKEEEKSKKPKLTGVVKTSQLEKPKKVEPVYIHIPLKPPEGQTDEFSYLANEPLASTALETKKEERTDSLDSTSPVASPKNDDIHFIFLTPPSDDEILEKEPDIPETPSSSSDDIVFFSSLKKLAQDAVDKVSPESKRKTLDTVREESVSDKSSINETEVIDDKNNAEELIKPNDGKDEIDKAPVLESKESNEKMIVDVEDGLNEMPKTEEHLKSALKSTETSSPKRVSFKRKSKQKQEKEKDDDYEQVEAPKEEVKNVFNVDKEVEINNQLQKDNENIVKKLDLSEKEETKKNILTTDPSQSMSIDEEKSYLDQQILKDTSLEDDYNKWSNASGDHEYEPINPPDEVTVLTSTSVLPNVTVVDSDNDPKVIFSATDILDKPIEEKKKPFFQFGKLQKLQNDKDKSQNLSGSSDTQSRSSLGKDAPTFNDQPKESEGPNKFQVALKQGTEQLKTKTNQLRNKLHNIKKPNIHLPKAPEFKRPQFKKSDSKKTDVKRFKIEKPKINLHFPKIPDKATIRIPHISLPGARKITETRTVETRQISTESNADESEQSTKRHKFDLTFGGTFPRFKKKKPEDGALFGTVPRPIKEKATYTASSESSSIRIPLHPEDSVDNDEKLDLREQTEREQTEFEDPISTGTAQGFSGNVTIEDEYERENQAINRADYLNRWQHGNFRERKDSESNEDERIIGQLVEQRFGKTEQGYNRYRKVDERIESLEERLRKDEDRPRYIEDEDEEFDIRLTQNRHLITDLDNLEDDQNEQIKDGYSSEGSMGLQRKGRLGKLDIDSDEFFVVHEIREGFQTPANALAQMNEYDPIGSNRSLPMQIEERQESLPIKAERKSIKKPKRRKTPHVSQEEIPGDEESLEGVTIPSKPKRRSKRIKKKSEKSDSVVPYQETIPLETDMLQMERLNFPRESLGILGDDEQDDQDFEFDGQMSKNKGSNISTNESPRFQEIDYRLNEKEEPSVPPRKHRSLKSLTNSEIEESVLSHPTNKNDKIFNIGNIEAQILQSDQIESAAPMRPTRRSRSHTSSLSRISLPPSQRDTDSVFTDEGYLGENQQIPSYLIENQNYKQQFRANEEVPSYLQDDERQPCVEEPCVQDLRDYMGYAIVDKSKQRDPPLPPPRTPSRRKKRSIEPEQKFATVPRNVGLSQTPPVRPLRNYSTLSHIQESKRDTSHYENDNENKENEINIGQYIEIDEEINRDLVSGEVVQKMRQRPLPAPPRPPRKPKTNRRSLQDITSQTNIVSVSQGLHEPQFKEENVSTQTEPLPPDFICEEVRQEPTDTIITPRSKEPESQIPESKIQQIQKFEIFDPRKQSAEMPDVRVKRELITPTQYTFEETVTHGTLLVQPMDGAEVLPEHQLSKERIIRVSRESFDEDETSEIPETFKRLKDPKNDTKVEANETMKSDKLQITDLNVERLTVNQLLASKIVVSEIDTTTLLADEIQGKSGTIKLSDLELPPELLSQLTKKASEDNEQKKTSINTNLDSAQKPANFHSFNVEPKEIASNIDIDNSNLNVEPVLAETLTSDQQQNHFQESIVSSDEQQIFSNQLSIEHTQDFQQHDSSPEPPVPPPRSSTLEESPPDAPPRTLRRKSKQDSPKLGTEESTSPQDPSPSRVDMLEPEVDDQPPPRPPQPLEGLYFPSQPPASFYALRAKQYVDENIPAVPRRKRHQSTRSRPVSRSHSTSDDSSGVPRRPSRISRPFSEPSISELSGRLIQACGSRVNNALKRLIYHLTENVFRNADGKQDLHVFMIILLVLIAGLILLGYGEDRTVVHLHHWEYFNPPKDI